jgi:hypothetical protein
MGAELAGARTGNAGIGGKVSEAHFGWRGGGDEVERSWS